MAWPRFDPAKCYGLPQAFSLIQVIPRPHFPGILNVPSASRAVKSVAAKVGGHRSGPDRMRLMAANLPLVPTGDRPVAKPGILDVSRESLRAWLAEHGQPPMRANQIRLQVLVNRATTFEAMTDLPNGSEPSSPRHSASSPPAMERHLASRRRHAQARRCGSHDDRLIECVLIQDDGRRTACISTQVGCGMGCVFCASGLNGVVRNLTAGEILEQLVRLRNLAAGPTSRLTHIVVMGMGEPLANLDNLLAALDVAGDKNGLGIGARHITISTVGLPAKIRRLADLGKQYHLAVSLHAPNDALRTQIVPTNDKTGIPADPGGGRLLLREDRPAGDLRVCRARRPERRAPTTPANWPACLRGRKAHVNLIPLNDVEGLPYRRPPRRGRCRAFIETLRRSGISVKVRKRKGSDIDAACGQLRRKVEQESGVEESGDRSRSRSKTEMSPPVPGT